jgi:hypothetical protein
MEMEYVGEILQDGHLSIPLEIEREFTVGEKVTVRLRKRVRRKTKGLSPQARDLIRMFEQSPDRGGYHGHEITREFIHESSVVWLENCLMATIAHRARLNFYCLTALSG